MGSRLRAAVFAAVLLAVCTAVAGTASAYTLPPAGGQFDYQIGGAYTPLTSVRVVSRDRTVAPVAAADVYNVCYVNTFQTQPDEVTWWEANHPTLLLRNGAGAYVIDGQWDEILLDTRTDAKRRQLSAIFDGWFRRCAADGFDAIEPDNLDSWSRSRRLITKAHNLALMRLFIPVAHAADLAIAQKNTSEIAGDGLGFDFAIAEECQVYTGEFGRECDDFIHYYGNLVYEIEYTDNQRSGDGGLGWYNAACRARGASISVILRDRQVTPFGNAAYRYSYC
jgi:hypothetical protein